MATILLALVVLSMGFQDYWDYSLAYHNNPATYMDVLQGTAPAPNQYRVGVIGTAGRCDAPYSPWPAHIFAANDVLMGWIAVLTLFFLLRRTPVYPDADSPLLCLSHRMHG